MTILRALKEMKLNGKLIHADEYIRADNPELFPQQKYVRNLTKDETAEILDEYVEYSEKLFSEIPPWKEIPKRVPMRELDQGKLF